MIKEKIFFNEYIKRELIKEKDIKEITAQLYHDEKIENAGISIIFVSDTYITGLNKQFFNKNRPTDVIAFTMNEEGEKLEGEVYISVDTAEKQAKEYNVELAEELMRLVVHGLLHLTGYDDNKENEQKVMKEREDYYIGLYKEMKPI